MIWQFIINGLITGILYSLLAIGFALVYNTTRIFHIAAAGIYVFAAYIFWWFSAKLGLPVIAAAIASIVLTMGLSWLANSTIYQPLKKRNSSLSVIMIASIGLMTVIVNLIAMLFGNETKVVENSILMTYHFGDLIITTPQLFQAIFSVTLISLFLILLKYTRYGLQIKALSSNEVLFETLGYDKKKTLSVVFLTSGLFISLASCLTVYDVGLDPNMGMAVLINAMVAMIIGGAGRIGACVIGGLSLGILQSLTVYCFASNWQNAITFALLLGFLFLRPQGIAGYKQRMF